MILFLVTLTAFVMPVYAVTTYYFFEALVHFAMAYYIYKYILR